MAAGQFIKMGGKLKCIIREIFSATSIKPDINFTAPPFDKDKWELYNLNEDWTETNDLASKYPEKLEELKNLFDSLAVANNVYPLKNYRQGLPAPFINPKTILYGQSTSRFKVNIGKGALSITSIIDINKSTDEGVLFATGGIFGGISLYIKESKIHLLFSDGRTDTTISSTHKLSIGKYSIRLAFTPEVNNSRSVSLFINDEKIADANIGTLAKQLSMAGSEGISVGRDMNSKVSDAYTGTYPFTGIIHRITIEQEIK